MGCALPVFLGLLALLAGARPVASRESAGVPASVLPHQHQSSDLGLDEFSALALNDLSALTEPWLPASSAPAPERGLYTLSNTTSLQAMDTEAGVGKRLRGVGIFGPNIPNELQVFFQNGLKWYYTWRCAHLPPRKHAVPVLCTSVQFPGSFGRVFSHLPALMCIKLLYSHLFCMRSPYSDPASFQMARLYNAEFVPMIVRPHLVTAVQLCRAAPPARIVDSGAEGFASVVLVLA